MSAESIIKDKLSAEISGINASSIDEVLSRMSGLSSTEKERLKVILTEKSYPFLALEGYIDGQKPRANTAYIFEGNFSENESMLGQYETLESDQHNLGGTCTISGRAETRILIAAMKLNDCILLVKFVRALLIKLRLPFEYAGLRDQNIASHEINYDPAQVGNLALKNITFSYQQWIGAI